MNSKSGGSGSAKVLAGVLAIIAALGIIVLGTKAGLVGQPPTAANANISGAVKVVSAAADIPAGQQIQASDLTLVDYLPDTVPARSFTDSAAVVGNWALNPIAKGRPVIADDISNINGGLPLNASSPKDAGKQASLPVPAGDVAIAVPAAGIGGTGGPATSALNDVGNFVQPGDRVDVIGDIGDGTVRYLFQDVPVLKVGSSGVNLANVPPDVLVLALPRADAVKLAFLISSPTTKELKFVLRGKADSGSGAVTAPGVNNGSLGLPSQAPSPSGH